MWQTLGVYTERYSNRIPQNKILEKRKLNRILSHKGNLVLIFCTTS